MPEAYSQRSTAETSIARQRLAKHVSAATKKHNNRGTAGGGDLYSVLPVVIKGGHVRARSQYSSIVEFRSCKTIETGE
jgi:hypothetical protein